MKTIKKALFLSVTLLIGMVLALGFGEGILRIQGFEYTLYPSKIQFGWPDPIILKDLYVVDKDLLWVPKNYKKTIAEWREISPSIVFMGDSCTEFGIYPSETGRYEYAFEDLLKERKSDLDVRLLNLGISGWSSYQGFKQLQRDIVPMAPKIVTVYYGWNDHWLSFGIPDKEISQYNISLPPMVLKLNRFRLVQLFNFFYIKHFFHDFGINRPNRVSVEDFRINLLNIVTISRAHNIIPILFTAPSFHEKGKEPSYLTVRWLNDLTQLISLHQKYVEVVRDVAKSNNVALLDLAQRFDTAPYYNNKHLYFMADGIHLTLQGHKKVAEFMYDYFQEHQLFKVLNRKPVEEK